MLVGKHFHCALLHFFNDHFPLTTHVPRLPSEILAAVWLIAKGGSDSAPFVAVEVDSLDVCRSAAIS
jgi:hypothetical protein